MAMPRKLKLMNVFLNGYSYQGVAKSVTLPKLTRKLENYRGAGMNGSAPVDLGKVVTHQRPEAAKAEGKTETQKERETPARTGAPESETGHAEESAKSTGSARR